MAGKLVKKVMLEIVSNDGDTELKLDRISEKADELGRKHPELEPKIKIAAAQAKLAVLRADLKATAAEADKGMVESAAVAEVKGGRTGILGRLFMGSSGNGGGLFSRLGGGGGGGIASTVGSAVEEGGSAGEEAGSSGGGGGFLGAALGVAGAGALLAGLQGIVPMLASAGLGVGAFAAVAYPQFSKIGASITQINADTAAYDRATTKAAKSSALKHIQQDWAGMSKPQREAVRGIQSLESGFGKISAKLSPLVFKVFADGLKVANQMLPFIAPLATAAGNAIDGLLGNFSKFVASPGFRGFMANMTKLAGPSIKTFGEGIGKIVIALGKLIVSFENPNMQRAVSGLFTGIAGAITGIAWAFTHVTPVVVKFYAWVARTFRSGVKEAGNFGRGVGRVLRDVGGWLHDGERDWDRFTGGISGAARRAGGIFATVRGDARLLWDAITRGGAPLRRVEADMKKFGATVRKAAGDVVRDVNHLGSEAWHWLGQVVPRAVDAVTGWFGKLPGKASSAMGGMLSSVTTKGGQVLNWFSQLPGRIGAELARLPGEMLAIGEHVISGLINGIESGVGRLFSSVKHIAGIVTSTLSGLFKLGSPSRLTFYHGQMLAAGLALGIDSGHGRVQSAAARMAGAATGLGGAAGGGRGGQLVIEIHAPKSAGQVLLPPGFWTELAEGIRSRGGSSGILVKKVKFA